MDAQIIEMVLLNLPNFVGLVLLGIILYRVNMRQADTIDRQDDTIKALATKCLEAQTDDTNAQREDV